MRAWIDVAVLARTKNIKGGLVARSASGLPFLLEEGSRVALVPPVLDAPRHVRVASAVPQGADEAVVFFDEVTDADVAEMLVGCHCLVRRDEVDLSFLEEQDDLPSWEGWEVFDVSCGKVGAVETIEERPLQPLLVISRSNADSVLVPLAEEFIVDVDEGARVIKLDCPRGLLDL